MKVLEFVWERKEGGIFLLLLRNWVVLTQLKLTATTPYDLSCPNMHKMVRARSRKSCVIYFPLMKTVDWHKKINAPRGILVSRSLYLNHGRDSEDKIRMSVFKIQLRMECQSSPSSLSFSIINGRNKLEFKQSND